uniref:Uncharacterized protein n=1 Tax=Arundo donax TaxID=35708 RepID=A0A0A9CD91_ARUDO
MCFRSSPILILSGESCSV